VFDGPAWREGDEDGVDQHQAAGTVRLHPLGQANGVLAPGRPSPEQPFSAQGSCAHDPGHKQKSGHFTSSKIRTD
jgi:hypothetical protein